MTVRLVRLLAAAQRDAGVVCRRAGVSIEVVSNPASRVPYGAADAFLDACVAELGARGFTRRLAATFDEQTYDAAGLVLLSSETLAQGLERAFAYQRLWGDGERFSLVRDARSGAVRFRHPGPSPTARAVLAELALLETMSAVRTLVAADAVANAVRFTCPKPAYDDPGLTKDFGIAPSYGEPENELVLDEALLSAPLRVPLEMLGHLHRGLADRAMAALPSVASLAQRIRALCNEDPTALGLGLERIAARLHVAPRSMQRRLASEGHSWSGLRDDIRREQVRRLDLRGAAEKEAAFIVGFSDPSALARARRRWARQPSQRGWP